MKRLIILPAVLCLAACAPSADRKISEKQEQISAEADARVGMPAIVNYQEKRFLKMVMELRDSSLATTTYVPTITGQLMKLCDGVGYGIPAATQYTNPQKVDTSYGHYQVLAQADPNGLFSPTTAEGTWVMCVDPADKKIKAVYAEPRVIVSPFPIKLTPVQ